MGEAGQDIAGYGRAGHRRSRAEEYSGTGRGGRPKYQLLARFRRRLKVTSDSARRGISAQQRAVRDAEQPREKELFHVSPEPASPKMRKVVCKSSEAASTTAKGRN